MIERTPLTPSPTASLLERPGPASGCSSRARGPVTLGLVNDYEIILRGLRSMLEPFEARVRVIETEVGDDPDRPILERPVDVALFDTFAARRDSIERAERMIDEGRAGKIVLYTWDASDDFLAAARGIGAAAVVLKSVTGEQLVAAIEQVHDGARLGLDQATRGARTADGDTLSNREREVLALLALGMTNRSIADELYLSIDTVKTYVRRLFEKLEVNNRTQAALLAVGRDLAPPNRRRHRIGATADG